MEEFLTTEQLKSSPLFQNPRCLNNIQTKQNKTKNLTRIFKQRFIVVSSQAHSSGSQPRWPPRCQSLCGWPARRPLSTRPRAARSPRPAGGARTRLRAGAPMCRCSCCSAQTLPEERVSGRKGRHFQSALPHLQRQSSVRLRITRPNNIVWEPEEACEIHTRPVLSPVLIQGSLRH